MVGAAPLAKKAIESLVMPATVEMALLRQSPPEPSCSA
jgi:hypothetical protein